MRIGSPRFLAAGAAVVLLVAVAPPPSASASESGVELVFGSDYTDFGLVAVGSSATRSIDVTNVGEQGGTLDVFIQNDRDLFSAPATIDVPAGATAQLDVAYTPTRAGQAATGIVLYTGSDAWVTQVGGMAADPPADDAEQAVVIQVVPGETFYYGTDTRLATTSTLEASCGVSNGIWFTYTAPEDVVLTFVSPPVGEVRDGRLVGCSSGGGLPYTVLAGDTVSFFTGTGGEPGWLDIWAMVQPLPHYALGISPKATVDRQGVLTVSGTASNRPDGDMYLTVSVRQKSGHGYVKAVAGPMAYWLTADTTGWSVQLAPQSGKFVAGPVEVHAEALSPSGHGYGGTTKDLTVKASAVK